MQILNIYIWHLIQDTFLFPVIKSNLAQQDYIIDNDKLICPNREPNQYFSPIKKSTIYDPRCRHFYYYTI